MMLLKIAIRNIFRHRVRSTITISTIVFGCVALIFVGGFFENIFFQMRESHIAVQSGHIQIHRRGFKEDGRINPNKYLIDNPDEIKATINKFPEVKYVTARLEFSGLVSTGDNTIAFVGQGIEPANEKSIPLEDTYDLRALLRNGNYTGIPFMEAGLALAPDDLYEVVLGKGLAESMGAKPGVSLVILTNTVGGSTNALDVNIKGIFSTSEKEFDDIFLRVPYPTAQSLLNTKSAQSILIVLNKTQDTAKVYQDLKNIIIRNKMDLEISRWEDSADNYNKTVKLFNTFYLILTIVISIVVILGIFNTMNMSVMERFSEIGTIMALGTRGSGVMKLFMIEGVLLGTIGGALGVTVGALFAMLISEIGIKMPPPPGGTFDWLATIPIVPSILVYVFIFSAVIGGISALYPAYKASRLRIVEALRYR
jgi:putative ABC transport system permease protein